jgi:hypothetical protein
MSYNQNERNEYCAAIATMILVTVIAINFNNQFNL